jgi:hypothetical protein
LNTLLKFGHDVAKHVYFTVSRRTKITATFASYKKPVTNTLDTSSMIKLTHFNVYTNIRSKTSQTLNRIWKTCDPAFTNAGAIW